jgi:hypothetical protein
MVAAAVFGGERWMGPRRLGLAECKRVHSPESAAPTDVVHFIHEAGYLIRRPRRRARQAATGREAYRTLHRIALWRTHSAKCRILFRFWAPQRHFVGRFEIWLDI